MSKYMYLLSNLIKPFGIVSLTYSDNLKAILVVIDKPKALLHIVDLLKNNTWFSFKQLLDVWGSDYPWLKKRFQINYLLLSLKKNLRLILRLNVAETTPIDSLNGAFASATWLERETKDMFGVFFQGDNDFRRILTDYGFEGFPLRKDFPLSGYSEVRYDDEKKRVVQEPILINQEYRYFDYLSPWETK